MNGIKKIFIAICFSLFIPTVFLVGSCNNVWANSEVSHQMKSNVGITFTEDSMIEENNDNSGQSNTNGAFDKNNTQTNDKKKILPSTGTQQTIILSIIGIGLCVTSLLFKSRKLK
ncbi:LPXTG cell wall anchor domain-containing protein [Enterococcus faecalis]|uniref:LPXTG cell wall anchor domain-containing protein n=1 Tax=Enterococcus faecalis TaxID=1351 RepID=UPI0027E145AC|nr:LPXTG cell wall anchor domain-containing protein [Enterococcus faecalis]MDQ6109566.1 LPXTG cell wall anchor domain-containing protein [Enterococcus faecalis]MDQ6186797.1 LPXTG cell wall anchor domain-containing protein [Enterococcus faecalis]MDQ6225573.1 LPXTG cell wall anchor domain-containing protein [Enterococcus faecalis]MEB7428077.1 LPXTG cell wall anchor domain-containing protein [Enterococcus faecalis]